MQKQSDESFGGGQAQPVQTDDVGVHVEPYNIGFGFLEPAADQPLSGCPSRDAHDVDGIGPQVNPWHYEPGASEASPSVLPSDGFDGVSLQQFDSTQTENHPVVSSAVYDAIFARNLFSNLDATNIKLPWEEGIFKEIFADDPMPDALVPKMPIAEFCSFEIDQPPLSVASSMASLANPTLKMPVFESCVASGDDLHFYSKRRQLRDTAIGKFLVVLRYNLEASITGKQILDECQNDQQQHHAYEIVDAVLGVKSPATLIKRANALLAFMRWFAREGKTDSNPFQEAVVWEYFQYLKFSGAPATKADTMMSSLRFAFHILGFSCLSGALSSRRLVGACELMLAGKRLLKQALVLTVHQVTALHAILEDVNRHIIDRALVAYILFALYGRCRNSDLLAIHSLTPDFSDDGGYVIITTCNHKSGRMASLKTRLLPIVVPARGVDGSIWPSKALAVISEAGCPTRSFNEGPLLPAPANGFGDFMQRGLRSSEVSKMLRTFLGIEGLSKDGTEEVVSSHSLKATMLAWAARFGLSPQTRSLLGRHTSCLNETFAIYSRDLACAPVAELQKMIDAIHTGTFSPDGERSTFFKPQTHEPHHENLVAVKEETVADDGFIFISDSECNEPIDEGERLTHVDAPTATDGDALFNGGSDSDSSSSEASSSDGSDAVVMQPRVKRFRAKIPDHESWYVHAKSTLVHRFNGDEHNDVKFLVCGKRLTAAYSPCTEATAWNTLCKSCNRK